MIRKIKYYLQKLIGQIFEKPILLQGKKIGYSLVKSHISNTTVTENTKINHPFNFDNVSIGEFSYIAKNSDITNTIIGKFCSIGPNFCCGMGLHPTHGISTSPMFYSTARQNGITLTKTDKIIESKQTEIGNDVFIGANVTIIDGVKIGDGAIVGAGAVVTRDIPPFAIAVGVPARIVKYRFSKQQIDEINNIKWWNFEYNKLKAVEKYFFNIDEFIDKYYLDNFEN